MKRRSSQRVIRVLLAEDSAADAELELRELKRAGLVVETQIANSEEAFREALASFRPDVILSDFTMPRFDGLAALALARELSPDTPFIFVSGTLGEEYAIRALKNGASDYVLKSNLMRLPAAVERALQDSRERAARRETEGQLAVARERLASVFAALPDVVWSVALPSRKLIYVSPAVSRVYGCTVEQAQGDPDFWTKAIHPEDRERVLSEWPAPQDSDTHEIEYRLVRHDGEVRWINVRRRVFAGAAGVPERVDGLVRDVTEQVLQRQRLDRLSQVRDLTSEINSALVRLRNRQEVFDEFCRIAVTKGGFAAARVLALDDTGRRLRFAGSAGAEWDSLNRVLGEFNSDPEGARGLLATALRTGKPVVSNNVASDERVSTHVKPGAGEGYSIAMFPLVVEDRVMGAVSLRSSAPNAFDQGQVRLLAELTGNLSFALELMEKQARIDYLAYYDALTGLPNRTLLRDRLVQAIHVAQRTETRLALMLLDLGRFKTINDTLGQHVGDRVLQLVAQRLREATADQSRLGRFGGDQFAVIFPEVRDAVQVARATTVTLAQFLEIPFNIEGRELQLGVKAGIAVFPDDGGDAETLLRNAEASLLRAKETGEPFLFYAPQMNVRLAEQVELEHALRRAVDRGELDLHFQPKVEIATRRIVGLEALLRWTGPDGKPVSPVRFVPLLEETGLIFEAGRQALATAASVYRAWKAAGVDAPRIAVNVSSLQLRKVTFVEDLRSALAGSEESGVDMEITESLLMESVEESIAKLRRVRELGIRIALDDFGTGYSSLAYLSRLPIDAVKIDRAFVRGVTEKADDTAIVSAIISLAQALRLTVIAEGVETEEQAQLLRLLRCDQLQGFLFSAPVPREQVEAMLRARAG
jgi:diguanylate cyclase (GGDEF)-like protein/PAS domain S-box-containing protein